MTYTNANCNAIDHASDVAKKRANYRSALVPCGPRMSPCTEIGPEYGIAIGLVCFQEF